MDFDKLVRAWLLPLITFVAGFGCGVVFALVQGYLSINWESLF
jgi:hypothetical protein